MRRGVRRHDPRGRPYDGVDIDGLPVGENHGHSDVLSFAQVTLETSEHDVWSRRRKSAARPTRDREPTQERRADRVAIAEVLEDRDRSRR